MVAMQTCSVRAHSTPDRALAETSCPNLELALHVSSALSVLLT